MTRFTNKKENVFLIFVHIEKASGTSINHFLKNNIPTYLTLNSPRFWSEKFNGEINENELSKIISLFPFVKGVGGHTLRSYYNYQRVIPNRKVKFITYLREPISRYVSHYNYQRERMNIPWKIEEFLNEDKFTNFQTKKIAGEENVELAKRIIKEKFDFAGITEEFENSVKLLSKIFPDLIKKTRFEERNILPKGNKYIRYSDFKSDIQNSIVLKNKMDIELYDFVRDDLYKEMKERLLLEEELNTLHVDNNFKYLLASKVLLKLYKTIFEKIIFPVIY